MKRLAVIPSDPIEEYLKGGYSEKWLRSYYNPCRFFDEVYLLSPLEKTQDDLLGMKVVHTPPEELKKRIKELKIDVIRAYGGNWACRMACENKVNGVPVVVSVHDTNPAILYDSVKKADIVWCVSKGVKELVATKFKHKDRIWILPNRVNFETMRPLPSSAWQDLDEKFPFKHKVLLVGRLTKQKNLDTLLKALKLLGPDYGVVAVGRGDRGVYEAMAKQQGVRCSFVESVNHEELGRYYGWCDCMCTPSRWEGFGMVFIEALACEAVVVTSDISPMNEFIKDAENGILIKNYENPRHMAEAVEKACTDQALRMYLKKNARSSVERFEKSRIDSLEAKYYKEVLEIKAGKPLVQTADLDAAYQRALDWVKNNTLKGQGIIITSRRRKPYPEVSGYFIPTLMDAGEFDLALQYAEFLVSIQRSNGSFTGDDGREYIFDSGQVLRGLLRASQRWDKFKPSARKTADYLVDSMQPDGCLPAVYDYEISPGIQVFVLPALAYAAQVFRDDRYMKAAQQAVRYYKNLPHVLAQKPITHFLAYIIDGFIDMGEADFVRQVVKDIFSRQKKDGSISAFPHVRWVCSTGVAQLGIIAGKLRMYREMEAAAHYLAAAQNAGGGFSGSYGLFGKYFPGEEISWANKFFLDLVHMQRRIKVP